LILVCNLQDSVRASNSYENLGSFAIRLVQECGVAAVILVVVDPSFGKRKDDGVIMTMRDDSE
jgi:hypothetical protein